MARRLCRIGLSAFVCIGLMIPAVWLAGCGEQVLPAGSNGDLKVLITDTPFPINMIEEATVTITRVEVCRVNEDEDDTSDDDVDADDTVEAAATATPDNEEPEEEEDDSSWIVVWEGEQEFNLLDLRNGRTDVLADVILEPGTYKQVRLVVTEGRVVIGEGDERREFVLKVPSGEQTGIKFHLRFEITAGEETTLLLDVDLSRAFKPIPGGHVDNLDRIREFKFHPSFGMRLIKLIEAGSISGIVTDAEGAPLADVQVTALRDAEEVSTTFTDPDGTYQFLGLSPGVYTLHLSADGFEDGELTDIEVVSGENTEAPDVAIVASAD